MTQNEKIFLLVAHYLSFSEAAKKAYVSQQCISDHIIRIEKEYNTKLFNRKPYLHLTTTGQILYKSLSNIESIENNVKKSINEITTGQKGQFKVGISTSRSNIILPKVLKKYNEVFPDIKIKFFIGDTILLEEQLRKNKIDLFLGINTNLNLDFSIEKICNDSMYLIINKTLFKKYFSKEDFTNFKKGVDLNRFKDVPMTIYNKTGALHTLLSQHMISHGIKLNNILYYTSECETQMNLCLEGVTFCIVPKMLYSNFYNSDKIYLFPIKDFEYSLRVDLVQNKYIEPPNYVKAFCRILKEELIRLSE